MGEEHAHENVGLRGVHAATTKVSKIDGEAGKLYYRGYSIEDLAAKSSFEEVAYLLIHGKMPNQSQMDEFQSRFTSERRLPSEIIEFMKVIPKNTPPMAVLQSSVALLSAFCPELEDEKIDANQRKAVRILAKTPCIIASWNRIRNGLEHVEPDHNLSHAADFLRMIHGEEVKEEVGRCFNVALLLHADHTFNASTFTARVVSSTRAHLYASISGAVGSLAGVLHGGANSRVMKNLQEIGEIDKVEDYVTAQLDAGKRIMGMGHAVYRTMDPRAKVLRRMALSLIEQLKDDKWYLMTNRLVEVTQSEFKKRKGRELFPNVDLFSASVYHMMGIPTDLFTPIFAMSRTAGWVAHIIEERFPEPPLKPVIYRPKAHYDGEYCGEEGCEYIPIAERE